MAQIEMDFRGSTYDPTLDHGRLSTLQKRVAFFMLRGGWHMLSDIVKNCGGSEASVSARLRDLRKLGYIVERRRFHPKSGLWEYHVAGH